MSGFYQKYVSKINATYPVVKFNMKELEGDDFSLELSVEDIIDYDSLEKCNEFESIKIVLEEDRVRAEALNAVGLHEKFDEEDVYVVFVPLTFMNEDNIPLVRLDGIPKQPFVNARCNQFYKYEHFYQKHIESKTCYFV